jgi:hypothetical protein
MTRGRPRFRRRVVVPALVVAVGVAGVAVLAGEENAGGGRLEVLAPDAVSAGAATLRARTSCTVPGCTVTWRYRIAGAEAWTATRSSARAGSGGVFAQPLSGLRPGTRYEYEACAKAGSTACGVGTLRTRLRVAPPPLAPDAIRIDLERYPRYCSGEQSRTDFSSPALSGSDAIIGLPRSRPLTCPLVIIGGRNVVVMGGEIRLPEVVGDLMAGSHPVPARHYGVLLENQSGTAYVEGLELGGPGLTIPFVLSNGIGGRVVLQHIRVDDMRSCWADEACLAQLHGDCIQTWRGPKVLEVDGFTCRTDYFGLLLRPWQFTRTPATRPAAFTFSHVDIAPASGPDRTRYMLWTELDGLPGPWPMRFGDAWVEPNRGRAPASAQAAFPYIRRRTRAYGLCWPDPDGPGPAATCPPAPGFNLGRPPGGPFVPAGEAGRGYRSPGYPAAPSR